MPSRRAPISLRAHTCSSLPNTSCSVSQNPFCLTLFSHVTSASRPRTSPAIGWSPGTCQTTLEATRVRNVAWSLARKASAVRRYAAALGCSGLTGRNSREPRSPASPRPKRQPSDAVGREHDADHPTCVGALEPDQPALTEGDHRVVGDAGDQHTREPSEVGKMPDEHEVFG